MSVKQAQSLKELQSRKNKLLVKKKSVEKEQNDLRKEHNRLKDQLNHINSQIKKMQKKDVTVSEHAILRYLERTMGLNIEEIKRKILTDKAKLAIATLGNGKIPSGDCTLVVKDNTVVSVV